MSNLTPEQRARETIDVMLAASGWVVQSKDVVNLAASRGVAICEISFATGAPDYTLFVDGRAIGTVEQVRKGIAVHRHARGGGHVDFTFWMDRLC